MRITKQQQIGVGDNDETTLERKFFTSAENLALERSFHERKYLSSADASMLAFNLDIPRKKVNWSQYVIMSQKKAFIKRTPSSNCSEIQAFHNFCISD